MEFKEGFAQSEGFLDKDFLDIRGVKPGLYWVKIRTQAGVVVKQLVKK